MSGTDAFVVHGSAGVSFDAPPAFELAEFQPNDNAPHNIHGSAASYAAESSATLGAISVETKAGSAFVLAKVLDHQGNSPYWIQIVGQTMYVLVTQDRVIKRFDITDPLNPKLLTTSPTLAVGDNYIQVRGQNVYLANINNATFQVFDATTLAQVSTAKATGGGNRFDVDPFGHYLFSGGQESGGSANMPVLIDVSDRTAPVQVGVGPASGSTHRGVAWIDSTHWALISRDDAKILIFDTSNPAKPAVVASVAAHGTVTTPCLISNGVLYVGNYGTTGVFEAWDITTPTAPKFLSSVTYNSGGGSEEIAIRGNVAYIACRATNQIAAIDISNPAKLKRLGLTSVPAGLSITPGVGADPTGQYVYQSAAGDTTNGRIIIWSTPGYLLPNQVSWDPSLNEDIGDSDSIFPADFAKGEEHVYGSAATIQILEGRPQYGSATVLLEDLNLDKLRPAQDLLDNADYAVTHDQPSGALKAASGAIPTNLDPDILIAPKQQLPQGNNSDIANDAPTGALTGGPSGVAPTSDYNEDVPSPSVTLAAGNDSDITTTAPVAPGAGSYQASGQVAQVQRGEGGGVTWTPPTTQYGTSAP